MLGPLTAALHIHLVVWRSTTAVSGELFVMTDLDRLMLMWHADSWAMSQLLRMEEWAPWGRCMYNNNYYMNTVL